MTVKRFQCSNGERLAQVLARDPVVPYRAYRLRAGGAPFDRWAAGRAARLLCNATGAFETDSGAIGWKSLAWDSELLGFAAARIEVLATGGGYNEARDIASQLIAKAVEDAVAIGACRHIVARVDASSLALSHALSANGFELIDGIQTFAIDLPTAGGLAPPPGTRLANSADADAIADIARSSFIFDRFHSDISISSDAANRLHETWARNSVACEAADAVLLAGLVEIDAFVTVKIDRDAASPLGLSIASIPLVATRLEARGQGAARRATNAATAWCRSQGVDIVEVGTQIANVPAARLYQSAGFRTTAISLTYRKWID